MELAIAQNTASNESVRTVIKGSKKWYLVKDILKGYDDYSVNTLFNRVGKRRKKLFDNHMYVDEKGVQILCHYITGELNSLFERQLLGKPKEEKPPVKEIAIDNKPIIEENAPKEKTTPMMSFEIEILKRKVKELQTKMDYLMSIFSGITPEEEKTVKIKENTLVDKLLKEPHVEPERSYWSAWCCSMINKLFYAAQDAGERIERREFYILIYNQLEDKFGINLYQLKRKKKSVSYLKVIETKEEWRQYLTGIILKQANLAGVTANATFENGGPIPMVNVP